jgi:hypothetical protein
LWLIESPNGCASADILNFSFIVTQTHIVTEKGREKAPRLSSGGCIALFLVVGEADVGISR